MSLSKTIGMVSGGQLGRMLTEQAQKLGFSVLVLDPTLNCPAAQIGAEQIVGNWKDPVLLAEIVERSDYFTIEIEHIDTNVLEKYLDITPINPKPATIKLIQNKFEQKKFLALNKFPVGDFKEILTLADAKNVLSEYKGRFVLKSQTDAYDGRGNAYIDSEQSLETALESFSDRALYAEKLVNFKKELAVMVAKDYRGNVVSYPVVETKHDRSICTEVIAPADIDDALAQQAKNIAKNLVKKLEGAGVYGVELFVTQDNKILINEIAPRVHNSGHYTMDACKTSQFEQHIRAITGLDLTSCKMNQKACVMINILGERNGDVMLSGIEEAMLIPGVNVYIYGKNPTKIDRKMGHINAVASTIEEAKANANKARRLISI